MKVVQFQSQHKEAKEVSGIPDGEIIMSRDSSTDWTLLFYTALYYRKKEVGGGGGQSTNEIASFPVHSFPRELDWILSKMIPREPT